MTRSQPLPREDGLLDGQLVVGVPVEAAADLRVLALVVLAHDDHVDLGGRPVGERRSNALQEPDRAAGSRTGGRSARIGIKRPHSETWSGHARSADRAEEDRVAGLRSCSGPSSGIIRPVFAEALAAPVELGPRELEAEPSWPLPRGPAGPRARPRCRSRRRESPRSDGACAPLVTRRRRGRPGAGQRRHRHGPERIPPIERGQCESSRRGRIGPAADRAAPIDQRRSSARRPPSVRARPRHAPR